jgi:hypothetical protein
MLNHLTQQILNPKTQHYFPTIPAQVKPLKPKLAYMLFKNSVLTSKRTPHFTITKIN